MKVKELIKLLSALPEDYDVLVNGYEGGLDDVIRLESISYNRNTNEEGFSWWGNHEEDPKGEYLGVLFQGGKTENNRK